VLVRHTATVHGSTMVVWLFVVVLISDSVLRGSRAASVGARVECSWVEHDHQQRLEKRSSAHCWVLRRHLVGVSLAGPLLVLVA
jgi:hypothetical protein